MYFVALSVVAVSDEATTYSLKQKWKTSLLVRLIFCFVSVTKDHTRAELLPLCDYRQLYVQGL